MHLRIFFPKLIKILMDYLWRVLLHWSVIVESLLHMSKHLIWTDLTKQFSDLYIDVHIVYLMLKIMKRILNISTRWTTDGHSHLCQKLVPQKYGPIFAKSPHLNIPKKFKIYGQYLFVLYTMEKNNINQLLSCEIPLMVFEKISTKNIWLNVIQNLSNDKKIGIFFH